MKTVPTTDQIAAELAALKDLAPRVRHRSFFGDDNRAAIAAQIDVLTEQMTLAEMEARFGIDAFLDEDEWCDHIYQAAQDACDWLHGELADATPMSEGWKELAP